MSDVVYAVTGANGFLGNTVIRMLCEREKVRCLILPGSDRRPFADLNCEIFEGDVTKPESLETFFQVEPESELILIHCAAVVYTRSKYNETVRTVNVNGVQNIVEMTLRAHAKLIYVSSVHAIKEEPDYGVIGETKNFDPETVFGLYAKTKAEASAYVMQAVHEKGLQACIVHPSGIVGPGDYGDTHMTRLVKDYLDGKLSLCVKGGYDFVDVRDVANGVISASMNGKIGETYLLTNRYAEIREILDIIAEYKGKKKVRMIPFFLAQLGAPFMELYYELKKQPPLFSTYSLYTVRANANFDHTKAETELGYTVRDLQETVRDTVDWLEEQEKKS